MVFFKITAIMPEESKVLKIVNHEQFFRKKIIGNLWMGLIMTGSVLVQRSKKWFIVPAQLLALSIKE